MLDYVVLVWVSGFLVGLLIDGAAGWAISYAGTLILWVFAYGAFYSALVPKRGGVELSAQEGFSFLEEENRRITESAVFQRPSTATLRDTSEDMASTLYEVFRRGYARAPKAACLGYRHCVDGRAREYVWRSYDSVMKRFTRFGSGLLYVAKNLPLPLDLCPQARIALYGRSSVDWAVASEACHAFNWTLVAMHDTLSDEARIAALKLAKPVVVIVEPGLVQPLMRSLQLYPGKVQLVIIMEHGAQMPRSGGTFESDCPVPPAPDDSQVVVYQMVEILNLGDQHHAAHRPPSPEDVASILFTSSAEGEPRGVALTHRNLVSTMHSVMEAAMRIRSDDSYLAYLPLSHVLGHTLYELMIYAGARVGFYQGAASLLDDDVAALSPSVFVGVPQVFERIRARTMRAVDRMPLAIRALLWLLYDSQRCAVPYGLPCPLSERWAFPRFRNLLGGRVRQMLVGGAPCSADCHAFVRVFFSCPMMQGYGLTESAAGGMMTDYYAAFPYGNVGLPLRGCQVKLVSVDGYSAGVASRVPRGEIWLSGPNVAQGYLGGETPESTSAFIPDPRIPGKMWLRTGDLGEYNPALKHFRVVGRSKEIFKLSSGEYVAPARLESVYAVSPFVSMLLVHASADLSAVEALIQPDWAYIRSWASAREGAPPVDDDDALASWPVLLRAVQNSLADLAETAGLRRREIVSRFILCREPWTLQNGMLTPSQKLHRSRIECAFCNPATQRRV